MFEYLYLLLYKLFSLLVQVIPKSFLTPLASFLYILSKKYQKVINTNLDIAFPDISKEEKVRIGKRTYLNFLHTIAGFILRQKQTPEEILSSVTFVNDSALQKAIDAKKNILFITAHYGNWELIPTALTSHYHIPMSVVGKSLKSPKMQAILKKNREKFQIELIDKKGAMKGMIKALSHKRAIGLLVDHHTTTNEGAVVQFFGKEVTQTISAALLARKFDAIIFPVFISSEDFENHTITFYPQIDPLKTEDSKKDIQQMTQLQADAIEKAIKTKPDEWFWLHRRFKYCCKDLY